MLTDQQIFRRRAAGQPVFEDEREKNHQHMITLRLENTIGALNRVINMFSQRGFNLTSVSVGETNEPGISRMTLVTTGTDRIIAQVVKQLDNLIDTLSVDDVTEAPHVQRELCLVKVAADASNRSVLTGISDIFRGRVVNITTETMTFEVSGPPAKINGFIGMMDEYTILEVARSGRIAMRRKMEFEEDAE